MAGLARKGSWLFAALLAMLVFTGCVSTTSRPQPAVNEQKVLDSRLQLAVNYIQANNYVAAREHLNKALEIDRRSPEVHVLFAQIYWQEREFEIAEQYFNKALAYDSGFTRGRNNYGSFLMSRNRAPEACDQFRKGAEDLNYPRRSELFFKIGLCELMQARRDEARDAFLKTLALNGSFAPASLELADMAYADKNYSQAKQYLSHYDKYRRGPTARGLWLGVRLEHWFGNLDGRDSKGMALRNLFPDSEENLQYQQWLRNDYVER